MNKPNLLRSHLSQLSCTPQPVLATYPFPSFSSVSLPVVQLWKQLNQELEFPGLLFSQKFPTLLCLPLWNWSSQPRIQIAVLVAAPQNCSTAAAALHVTVVAGWTCNSLDSKIYLFNASVSSLECCIFESLTTLQFVVKSLVKISLLPTGIS